MFKRNLLICIFLLAFVFGIYTLFNSIEIAANRFSLLGPPMHPNFKVAFHEYLNGIQLAGFVISLFSGIAILLLLFLNVKYTNIYNAHVSKNNSTFTHLKQLVYKIFKILKRSICNIFNNFLDRWMPLGLISLFLILLGITNLLFYKYSYYLLNTPLEIMLQSKDFYGDILITLTNTLLFILIGLKNMFFNKFSFLLSIITMLITLISIYILISEFLVYNVVFYIIGLTLEIIILVLNRQKKIKTINLF